MPKHFLTTLSPYDTFFSGIDVLGPLGPSALQHIPGPYLAKLSNKLLKSKGATFSLACGRNIPLIARSLYGFGQMRAGVSHS